MKGRIAWFLVVAYGAGCGAGSGAEGSAGGSTAGQGGAGAATGSGGSTTDAGGFTPTSSGGGAGAGGSEACSSMLSATIRDFSSSHPDFQSFTGSDAFTGIVKAELGPDKKPAYAHPGGTAQTTGPNEFAQWYNDVPGVNQAFAVPLQLGESAPGKYAYDSSAFFPIDGQGFGDEGNGHNFHFTTEIHTTFRYLGGETFTFTGDDDLWLFINGRLAIDLGGAHPQLSASVELDQDAAKLGLTVGKMYPMDIFHAERHTSESNFHVETTIACFTPPPA